MLFHWPILVHVTKPVSIFWKTIYSGHSEKCSCLKVSKDHSWAVNFPIYIAMMFHGCIVCTFSQPCTFSDKPYIAVTLGMAIPSKYQRITDVQWISLLTLQWRFMGLPLIHFTYLVLSVRCNQILFSGNHPLRQLSALILLNYKTAYSSLSG